MRLARDVEIDLFIVYISMFTSCHIMPLLNEPNVLEEHVL